MRDISEPTEKQTSEKFSDCGGNIFSSLRMDGAACGGEKYSIRPWRSDANFEQGWKGHFDNSCGYIDSVNNSVRFFLFFFCFFFFCILVTCSNRWRRYVFFVLPSVVFRSRLSQ